MTRAMSKLCKCGCKTVLVWHEKKGQLISKVHTYELQQKVFCPKELDKPND